MRSAHTRTVLWEFLRYFLDHATFGPSEETAKGERSGEDCSFF
jgi:hypothetical protein